MSFKILCCLLLLCVSVLAGCQSQAERQVAEFTASKQTNERSPGRRAVLVQPRPEFVYSFPDSLPAYAPESLP